MTGEKGREEALNITLRPALARFAARMERTLRTQDHRGKEGWKNTTPEWLLDRVMQERDELRDAIQAWRSGSRPDRETREAVKHEATDVANFAMMISDLMGGD
jgi:NTP pyrophosphatase (non-canonical NTP hydrolase)